MTNAVFIEPDAILDDGALYQLFGIREGTAAKARREGKLRFTKQGPRILYLGKWVVDWLEADGTRGVAHAEATA
jgi:hypothetical protein